MGPPAMATILIIDDNETIREGLAHTVKKLGHDAVIGGERRGRHRGVQGRSAPTS